MACSLISGLLNIGRWITDGKEGKSWVSCFMSCSWHYVLIICCLRRFIFSKKVRQTLKARFARLTGPRVSHVNTFSSIVSFKFFLQKCLLKTQCHLSYHRAMKSLPTAVLPTERLSQMFSTPFWEEGGVSWMSMFCTLC